MIKNNGGSKPQCFFAVAKPGSRFTHTDLIKATDRETSFAISKRGIIFSRQLLDGKGKSVARIRKPDPYDASKTLDDDDLGAGDSAYTRERQMESSEATGQLERHVPKTRVSWADNPQVYEPKEDTLPITRIAMSHEPFRTHGGLTAGSKQPGATDHAVWTMSQERPFVISNGPGGTVWAVTIADNTLEISDQGNSGVLPIGELPPWIPPELQKSFKWRTGIWKWQYQPEVESPPRVVDITDDPLALVKTDAVRLLLPSAAGTSPVGTDGVAQSLVVPGSPCRMTSVVVAPIPSEDEESDDSESEPEVPHEPPIRRPDRIPEGLKRVIERVAAESAVNWTTTRRTRPGSLARRPGD